jgi:hypothetical protein
MARALPTDLENAGCDRNFDASPSPQSAAATQPPVQEFRRQEASRGQRRRGWGGIPPAKLRRILESRLH